MLLSNSIKRLVMLTQSSDMLDSSNLHSIHGHKQMKKSEEEKETINES